MKSELRVYPAKDHNLISKLSLQEGEEDCTEPHLLVPFGDVVD